MGEARGAGNGDASQGPAPPFRAARWDAAYFFFGLTAAFRVAPAENFGDFDAAILIAAPVDGLRPLRAARLATEKVPKPVIPTVSPFFRRSVMISMMVFTALFAAAPDNSVRFANSAISSPFFITNPPGLKERE